MNADILRYYEVNANFNHRLLTGKVCPHQWKCGEDAKPPCIGKEYCPVTFLAIPKAFQIAFKQLYNRFYA